MKTGRKRPILELVDPTKINKLVYKHLKLVK